MKPRTKLCAVILTIVAASAMLRASDRVAVYARVDRVVLEPATGAPDTIQIWGVFATAQPNNPNDYRPAARGYLYYRLPAAKEVARREWADLKQIAGSSQLVAFGSRWDGAPTVRPADERPANPDVYTVNTGLIKVQGRTDYAPIRALLDFTK
jgi:hypothetical protein